MKNNNIHVRISASWVLKGAMNILCMLMSSVIEMVCQNSEDFMQLFIAIHFSKNSYFYYLFLPLSYCFLVFYLQSALNKMYEKPFINKVIIILVFPATLHQLHYNSTV